MNVAALPVLFKTFLKSGRFRLHYSSLGRTGRITLAILRIINLVKDKPGQVRVSGYELRVDRFESPRLEIQALLPKQFNDTFFKLYQTEVDAAQYPDSKVLSSRVRTNLEKISAVQILQVLTLRELGKEWHKGNGIPLERLLVIAPGSDLATMIPPGWAGQNVEIVTVWNSGNSLSIRAVRAVIKLLVTGLRPRWKDRGRSPSISAMVNVTIDRTDRSDDLFWWWDSEIPAERVVLYVDRSDRPVSKDLIDQVRSLGISLVVINANREGSANDFDWWRPSPGPAVSLRRFWAQIRVLACGIGRDPVQRWLACRISDMHHNSVQISDFLEEFNIKAILHYQDAGMDSISIACDSSGAARIGWHYSHFPWPDASLKRLHQVYFTWGNQYATMLSSQGHSVDHLIYSGCTLPRSHMNQPTEEAARRARASAAASGASRFLTLFDTSLPTEDFYRFFLDKAIKDVRWGFLIKPKTFKRPWEMFDLPDLANLYQKAADTGRVIMLDPKISPVDAATAADLSVSVDLNSASIITALSGLRAIHLDYVRLHESNLSEFANLYTEGPDRLVFDDPDVLWDCLNKYYDESEAANDLGILSQQTLKDIDHFHDNSGPARIGQYIAWYLEASIQNMDRDSALESASQKYADRWGQETVRTGLPTAPYV